MTDRLREDEQSRTYGSSFAEILDGLFTDEDATALAEWAVRECPTDGLVLELGCGTGRVLAPVLRAGRRVEGWDLSEELLRRASERPGWADTAAHGRASLHRADIRCPVEGGHRADVVLIVGGTLSMFSLEGQEAVLATAASLVAPTGRVLVETHHRVRVDWVHRAGPTGDLLFDLPGGPMVRTRSQWDTVTGAWTLSHEWNGPDGLPRTAEESSTVLTDTERDAAALRAGLRRQALTDRHGAARPHVGSAQAWITYSPDERKS